MIRRFFLSVTLPYLASPIFLLPAQQDRFQPLFLIERSTNANVVHYEARITSQGTLHPSEPVIVYWKMLARDGRREDLNSFERKRVYGLSIKPHEESGGSFRINLAAQPGRDIHVFMDGAAVARAETRIAGKRALLRKLFISTGRVNIVHVNYIDLFGIDVATGAELRERITP
jgi:hypothetical protein